MIYPLFFNAGTLHLSLQQLLTAIPIQNYDEDGCHDKVIMGGILASASCTHSRGKVHSFCQPCCCKRRRF